MRTPKQPWHREDIIAAVRKRGTTLMELARRNGFAPRSFYTGLTSRFPNTHRIIAAAIGERRSTIWPQWYGADDQPLFRTRADLVRQGTATPQKEAA